MTKNINRMKQLISELNRASKAYYNTGETIMSDEDFDNKLAELQEIEDITGTVMSNSPTNKVGATVLSSLNKIEHKRPMLSLKKCHSIEEIHNFNKKQFDGNIVAMLKLDGLSVRLIYENGKLVSASTRGDGKVGSDITKHVKCFENVPLNIIKKERYIVDGEAVITYSDFEYINQRLQKTEQYKNPRNLAAGTLSLLNIKEVANRKLRFIAWDVVEGNKSNSFLNRLTELIDLNFEVVSFSVIPSSANNKSIEKVIESLKQDKIPCDGIVFKYDNIEFGNKQGYTSHHFNNAIAYKFRDDLYETILRDIEWNTSKSGVITPVAIFDAVKIDGTSVTRATLHNVTYLKNLKLGIGDTIQVFKANMIIPKIYDNITRSNTYQLPTICPVCGDKAEIRKDKESEILYCTSPNCKGKLVSKICRFVSKQGMDITNMSEKTIEKLVDLGLIKSFADIYLLENHKKDLIKIDKFGITLINKLLNSIKKSKMVTLDKFIYAIGINGIGKTQAENIAEKTGSWDNFMSAVYGLLDIHPEDAISRYLVDWYKNRYESDGIEELLKHITFKVNVDNHKGNKLSGMSFVITGSLEKFANRNELVDFIKNNGGIIQSSVSKKTSYLICNKISSSSKCKKANDIGVKIITEKELLEMIGG